MLKYSIKPSHSNLKRTSPKRKQIQLINQKNQQTADSFNIDKLLANGTILQVDQQGTVDIDYSNGEQRKAAEAWLRD